MFLFFQNSVNDNDNNTNNRDCFCHDTDDSEPSSQYESVTSADGSDFQPQPQHRSICSCWLVRVCGDGFHRCGRVGAHGSRADGDGGGAHAVPTVGNQPVTWGGAHAVPTVGNQLLHGVILLILKTLRLKNCFMKMKGLVDFQC